MLDDQVYMRDLIEIAAAYSVEASMNSETVLMEEVVPLNPVKETSPLIGEIEGLVSKLRGHRENDDNEDISTGVEMGMERAAGMLENLLRKFNGEHDIG
jgi:hypothetical protein